MLEAYPTPSGAGGSGITLSNFGPFNGTYGAGGGGCGWSDDQGAAGSPSAGRGVMTNQTAKNASGYANGGGGTENNGHPGGAATAGIFVLRVPDAVTITNSTGSTSGANGFKYLQITNPGTFSIS